jgi:hypothetical protein
MRKIARTGLQLTASGVTVLSRRWSAAGVSSVGGVSSSPVNVEEFTLNMEVVNRDMEAARRWADLSESMEIARKAGDNKTLLKLARDDGLGLLAQLGAENGPIHCESMLLLEVAQAHANLGDFAAAKKAASDARRAVGNSDASRLAEIDELLGFFAIKQRNGAEAESVFTALLKWIDQDSKKAMPMVAVAAVNMRRTVLMGLGMAKELKAATDRSQGLDGRAGLDAAVTHLIDALNLHLEAGNDPSSVKDTLLALHRCFLALGDVGQAVSTLAKYIGYCERSEDTQGASYGESELANLCATYNVANPVEEARAAAKAAELEAQKKAEREKKQASDAASELD